MALSPSDPSSPPATIPPIDRWVLLALSLILLLLGLLPRELWGTDEPIVGTIVREMVVDGQWLVPHVNHEVYPDKPPLYYWLAALPALASGLLTPLWLRLPATLAAIGCVWLTYRLGALLIGAAGGLLATVILATSPLFTVSAQIARMDMLLTLFITASLYCFARGMAEPAAALRWNLAIYPLAGLAFLTKGLIGSVVPAFVIGSVLLWQRDRKCLSRLHVGWGMLLAGLVVFPWLIPAVLQEGIGYAKNLFITQSLGRAVDSFAHNRPLYYYLYTFPPTFLPWIVFVPSALWLLWRRWAGEDWRLPFLMGWTVGLFLFFSVIGGKLVIYLLPLFPALALMVAALWREAFASSDESFSRRHLFWPTLLAAAVFAGAALAVPAMRLLPPDMPLPPLSGYASALVIITAIGMLLTWPPLPHRLFAIVLITVTLALGLATYVTESISAPFSPKPLGEMLRPYQETVPTMATYRLRRGWLNFYAERRMEELEEPTAVQRFLARDEPALCVLKESALGQLWEKFPTDLRVIGRETVGRVIYVIIANTKVP